MGKGNRNSQKRAQERIDTPEMNLSKQKKTKGKKSGTDRAVAIACLILAIIIVASLAAIVLRNQGVFSRLTDAVSGETVKVDAAMLNVFVNSKIEEWSSDYYNSMYMMYGLYSLDLTQSLKGQTISSTEASYLGATDFAGATWYDYFVNLTLSDMEMYVTYAELAKANGRDLTDEQKANIEENLESIKATLKESKMSFSDKYGKGVKASDVRRCLELIALYQNGAEFQQEQFEAVLEQDQKPMEEYVEAHKEDFYSADCLKFSITESRKNYSTDKAYEDAVRAAKAAAEKIAEAKTVADFIAAIDEYEASKKTETDKKEESTTATTETVDAEKELESKIEEHKVNISYSSDTDTEGLDDWLFGETPAEDGKTNVFVEEGSETAAATTTSSAKSVETESSSDTETETDTNETNTDTETETGTETETESGEKINSAVTEKDGKKVYPTQTISAYYVISSSHVDKELAHNFALLITNDKAPLEAFVTAFKNGELTSDEFIKLAEKQYNDAHASEDHEHSDSEVFFYQKYEDALANAFGSNYGESYKAIDTWVEDAARKDKDISEIIEIKVDDKTTHYAVVFFEKQSEKETWYVNSFNGVLSERVTAWYENQVKEKPVTINNKILDDIDVIVYAAATDDGHDH